MKSKLIKTILMICTVIMLTFAISIPTFATNAKGTGNGSDTTTSNDSGSSTTGNACSSDVPPSVQQAAGCSGSANDLPKAIQTILNSIILVSGTVAVAYIIVGGISYMTSSGDAGKVEKAKKTILYAAIGLIVCVLSFVIVNFVIKSLLGQP